MTNDEPRKARLDALRSLEPLHGIMQHPRHEFPIPIVVCPISLPHLSEGERRILKEIFWIAHPPVPLVPADLPGREARPAKPAISDDAKRLLMLVASKPNLYSSRYYEELGWALSTGTRVRKTLEDSGFIRIHRIRTGRQGGHPEIMELLQPAFMVLGIQKPSGNGKGSFEHAWWVFKNKQWLEKTDGEIVVEKMLNGKAVDVAVKTDVGWVAYECQLPNSVRADLLQDLMQKDLAAGFVRVVVCVLSRGDAEKVRSVIAEMEANPLQYGIVGINEKVEVRLLSEIL